MKEIFEKVDFEKYQQPTKIMKKYPGCKEFRSKCVKSGRADIIIGHCVPQHDSDFFQLESKGTREDKKCFGEFNVSGLLYIILSQPQLVHGVCEKTNALARLPG